MHKMSFRDFLAIFGFSEPRFNQHCLQIEGNCFTIIVNTDSKDHLMIIGDLEAPESECFIVETSRDVFEALKNWASSESNLPVNSN